MTGPKLIEILERILIAVSFMSVIVRVLLAESKVDDKGMH